MLRLPSGNQALSLPFLLLRLRMEFRGVAVTARRSGLFGDVERGPTEKWRKALADKAQPSRDRKADISTAGQDG